MVTETLLKDEQKHCPECGSESVRQTFASYLRNGPLLDPKWGDRRAAAGPSAEADARRRGCAA